MKKILIVILLLLLLCLASIAYIFKDKIFFNYSEKNNRVITEDLETKENIKVESVKNIEPVLSWARPWIWWSK